MSIRGNEEPVEGEDNTIYFLYRGGRKKQVSREEWERSWLEWWKRTSKAE